MLYKMKIKIFSTNKNIKRAVLIQRLHGSISILHTRNTMLI